MDLRLHARRNIVTAVIAGVLLLVITSQATQTVRTPASASLSPHQALRISAAQTTFAFSADARSLATVAPDNVVLRDVATGRARIAFADPGDAVSSVAFSPSGDTVAGITQRSRIILWDAASGFRRAVLSGHDDRITAIAFSSNGQALASAGKYSRIVVWNAVTGLAELALSNVDGVTSIAFSADGRSLASGGRDGAIKVWDVASGRLNATLKVATEALAGLTVSPNGATLAALLENGRIALLNLSD